MELDYGKMNDREKTAVNSILNFMVGCHFTPSVAEEIKRHLDIHTWPQVEPVKFHFDHLPHTNC